jgi:hypothetical protein
LPLKGYISQAIIAARGERLALNRRAPRQRKRKNIDGPPQARTRYSPSSIVFLEPRASKPELPLGGQRVFRQVGRYWWPSSSGESMIHLRQPRAPALSLARNWLEGPRASISHRLRCSRPPLPRVAAAVVVLAAAAAAAAAAATRARPSSAIIYGGRAVAPADSMLHSLGRVRQRLSNPPVSLCRPEGAAAPYTASGRTRARDVPELDNGFASAL